MKRTFPTPEVKFEANIGEKTQKTFERMLDYFALSECLYIINKSMKSGTKAYQSGKYNKKNAANLVKREIEEYTERVIVNNWTLYSCKRDFNIPESIISKLLFTNIMGIEYLGFTTVPTKDI